MTENLEVSRWLFKIDDEFDGRGIAYLDIADHLRCYPWAVKEAQRYGEKWIKKWAQVQNLLFRTILSFIELGLIISVYKNC